MVNYQFKYKFICALVLGLFFIAAAEGGKCDNENCKVLNATESSEINGNIVRSLVKKAAHENKKRKKRTAEDVKQGHITPIPILTKADRRTPILKDVSAPASEACEFRYRDKKTDDFTHTNITKGITCETGKYTHFIITLNDEPTNYVTMLIDVSPLKAVNGCLILQSNVIRDISPLAKLSSASYINPECSQLDLYLEDTSGNRQALKHLDSIFKGDGQQRQRFFRLVRKAVIYKTNGSPLKRISDIPDDTVIIKGDLIIDGNTKIDKDFPKIVYLEAGCLHIDNPNFHDFSRFDDLWEWTSIYEKCSGSMVSDIKGTSNYGYPGYISVALTTSLFDVIFSRLIVNPQTKQTTSKQLSVTVLGSDECILPVPLLRVSSLFNCVTIRNDVVIDKSTVVDMNPPSLHVVKGCLRVDNADIIHLEWLYDKPQKLATFENDCLFDKGKTSQIVLSVVKNNINKKLIEDLGKYTNAKSTYVYNKTISFRPQFICQWPKGGVDPAIVKTWLVKFNYECKKSQVLRMEDSTDIIDLLQWDEVMIYWLLQHKKHIRANIRKVVPEEDYRTTLQLLPQKYFHHSIDLTHIKLFGSGMLEIRNDFFLGLLDFPPTPVVCDSTTHSTCFNFTITNNQNLLSNFLASKPASLGLQPQLSCTPCPGGKPLNKTSDINGCVVIHGDLVIDPKTILDGATHSIRYLTQGCLRIVNSKMKDIMFLEHWSDQNIFRPLCEDGTESEFTFNYDPLEYTESLLNLHPSLRALKNNLQRSALQSLTIPQVVKFFGKAFLITNDQCTPQNLSRNCTHLAGNLIISKKVELDITIYHKLEQVIGDVILRDNYADFISLPSLKYVFGRLVIINNDFLEMVDMPNLQLVSSVTVQNNRLLDVKNVQLYAAIEYDRKELNQKIQFDAVPAVNFGKENGHYAGVPQVPPVVSVPAVFSDAVPIHQLNKNSLRKKLEQGPNYKHRFEVETATVDGIVQTFDIVSTLIVACIFLV